MLSTPTKSAESELATALAKEQQLAPFKEEELETLVKEENWRAELVELIISNKLDPWNIDIGQLAKAFMERLDTYIAEGFELPSNLVLAAAIILKFKSMSLKLKEEPSEDINLDVDEQTQIKETGLLIRRAPPAPITLKEIVKAVERALERMRKSAPPKKTPTLKETVIEINEEDVQKEVATLYERLVEMYKARREKILLSHLLNDKNDYPKGQGNDNMQGMQDIQNMAFSERLTKTLLRLLFLANEEKVELIQEELFGEVEVRLFEEAREAGEVN